MPAVKVTRELHVKVLEALKTQGSISTAKKFGLSPDTVRRIKRGRSYKGYKRELANDHIPLSSVFEKKPDFLTDEEPPKPRVSRWPVNLFDRAVAWLKGLRS